MLLCILSIGCGSVFAQSGGEWTWMKGNQPSNAMASYGVMGLPSPTNTPGSRYQAARWTDHQGNLWLHGGVSQDPQFGVCAFADMWMYDISLGMWVWMNGPMWGVFPYAGTYVSQGVFSPAYYPCPVNFGSTEFIDKDGNFWLLEGNGSQNLWKFDVSIYQWAWMNGPGLGSMPNGNPGPQNVFTPTTLPQSLTEHHCGWGDSLGNLWFFGGAGVNVSGASDVVWTYDTQLNQWKWVKGNPGVGYVAPVYGTQNVPSAANTPGTRNVYINWQSTADEFYLYGNGEYAAVGGAYYDMWKYNYQTNEWTWVSGIQGAQQVYPTPLSGGICVPSATDYPVRDSEWHLNGNKPDCDLFYTFGGNPGPLSPHLTLYRYNVATNQWTLLHEDFTGQRVYGTYQVPGPNVLPGVHMGGVGWVDYDGNFWVYGGFSNTSDELWRFTPSPPSAGFSCDTVVCLGDTVHFALSSTGLCGLSGRLSWDFGDQATLADTSSAAAVGWVYAQPGTYTATLVAFDSSRCEVWRDTHQVVITVHPQPVVDLGSDTVICPPQQTYLLDAGNPGFNYSWSTGATTQTISPGSNGVYSVTVSVANCIASDTVQLTFPVAPALGDTSICAGQSTTLNAGVPGQHYIWSTGDTTASITVNTGGFYTVTVIVPPCSLSSTMQLTLIPLPVVNLGNDTVLCPGATLLLDAQNPGAAWNWNTGDVTQTLLADSTGLYAVNVTVSGNCSDADSIQVNITRPVNLGPDASLCGTLNGITLDAGYPGAAHLWNTGDTTQTILVTTPGNYSVTLNTGPCTLRDSILVTGSLGEAMLFMPNSFTPNGDGLNDRFTGTVEGLTEYHLLIFNRWGDLIFETFDPAGWDGAYATNMAQNEVYVYRLSYKSTCTGNAPQTRLGHVVLIR
ncbi:MAG: gliding motility-associated C-terminal domain-containing protein [Bacteroidetes bacterium]|nr:gliding motility-associated C-terminal domain-containing protein [Bacteroidota bacterium]